MPNILIIGATRGLGAELAKHYATLNNSVYATSRSPTAPPSNPLHPAINWIPNIDISTPHASPNLISALKDHKLHTIILSAGYFGKESFSTPNWDAQVKMYTTSAIAPVFLISALYHAGNLIEGTSKIVIVSSEAGSLALRHDKEGGGMYGHHASKAASNMVGRLLSLDLKGRGIAVGMVHPGFMRTEMTAGVGFDEFWDQGGAVMPDVAARSLVEWVEGEFGMDRTGTFWAPRGAGDIGTADVVLGDKERLPVPLELPW